MADQKISQLANADPLTGTELLVLVQSGNNVKATADDLIDLAGTDLSYDSSTRALSSSTGTDTTLPLASGAVAGLMSSAEHNKLAGVAAGAEVNVNADWNAGSGDAQILNKPTLGTAAALNVGTAAGNVVQLDNSAKLPAIDGSALTGINAATDLSYNASTRVLASSTGTDATLPVATTSDAGLLSSSDKTKLDGIAAGAEVNVNADWNAASGDAQILNKPTLGTAAALNVGTGANNVVQLDGSAKLPAVDGSALTGINAATDLSYTAATRVLASSTGTDATLPLVTSTDAGLAPASGGGTTNFLRADGTWAAAGSPPAGSNTQIQFNDSGAFGGDADLTYNKTTNALSIGGDVTLNDGGSFTTTLQTITPTANRTLSLPDATGTVGLVGGSSGQLTWNNAGAYAGASTLTYDGSILTTSGRFINSYNAAASAPAKAFTGTWFTGGTATTTKPQVLIEPTGATSTAWSTSGTGLGVNAASGFAGNLLDLQVNGTSRFSVRQDSAIFLGTSAAISTVNSAAIYFAEGNNLSTTTGGFGLHGAVGFGRSVRLDSNVALAWNTSGPSSGADLGLHRDAAGTLAQRNGANAQTFRVYGTYTDGSNYVRAALSSTSTAVTLAAETAGTGADDITLNLTAAGTGTVKANSSLELADAKDIVLATTTGTKIGTATTQKLGFFNKTPVVQPAAVADLTTTATTGSLPTANGTVTIADAAAPTNAELLEYCVELEARLEAALGRLRDLGLIAT